MRVFSCLLASLALAHGYLPHQGPHQTGAAVKRPSGMRKGVLPQLPKALGLLPWLLTAGSTWAPPTPATASESYTSVTVASAFEAMCLGFGCGPYNGIDYDGSAAPADEPSISFQEFLKALDAKQVKKVELTGPNGDRAYASLVKSTGEDGVPVVERILIGEGFPSEQSKAWSSPLWVVRILNDRNVPVSTSFDFSQVKTKLNTPYNKP